MFLHGFCLALHPIFLFFFFFSSRRRHTRLQGDWSSDVCSSDLGRRGPGARGDPRPPRRPGRTAGREGDRPLVHRPPRSEEHTSELQSPCNLVCRLLLEKKKKKKEKCGCKKMK